MEKGLYKNDNGTLLCAVIEVTATDYHLSVENGEEGYGWKMFETRQEALDFYGITETPNIM